MQRSISNKNTLVTFIFVILFFAYTALSSIYLYLPPLLAVLFIFFSKALKNEDILYFSLVVFCLVVFEAENGYVLFSSVIYFSLIYRYVMPKIVKNSSCNACIKLLTVILIYVGFFLFNVLLANIFLLPMPSINYYVIYYILIEFLIMSML